MNRRLALIPLWFCLLSVAAVAQTSRTLLSFAPSSSDAVVRVDWINVKNDDLLRRAINGDTLERSLREVFIDPDAIVELVVFSDLTEPPNFNGMLVRGTYNQAKVLRGIADHGESAGVYRNRKIYYLSDARVYVTGLRGGQIVIGTKASLEEAIDIESRVSGGFTGKPVWRRLSEHLAAGQPPITMMLAVPESYQDMAKVLALISKMFLDFAGLGPLGDLLGKIGVARGFGLAMKHTDKDAPTKLVAIMADSDASATASGALNLMKRLASLTTRPEMTPNERAAAQATEQMSISRERELLIIQLVLPEDALRR